MFKVDDVIVYKNGGVCRVEAIGTPDFLDDGQDYYKLQSLVDAGSTVYVRVAPEPEMRAIISTETANQYLDGSIVVEECFDTDNKRRSKEYTDILSSCDCSRWMGMFKGILKEKNRKRQDGKTLNESDDKFLKRVSELVVSEFSSALSISKEEAMEKLIDVL